MKKFSKFITNHAIGILITCLLLVIPAIYGYLNTRINYDILVYLPDSVETIKGENILNDDFGLGAYAFVVVDSTNGKKILDLEKEIQNIEGVTNVFSLQDVLDVTVPSSFLPNEIVDKLEKDDETIILVTFDGTTSEDSTINAVRDLRTVVQDATKVSSMTSMVIDTMDLSNQEMFIYIVIAVVFCLSILFIATDSYIIPFLLIGNIGFAILYNMGSNYFLGEISYITQAITAILQLGVTMDFSIFLYHKYEQAKLKETVNNKYEAMQMAIYETFQSVIGSSLTTFAGFLALCTMDLTLGTDIGIVMAKGVLWGLICVLTLFPSLLLVFDKVIDKTKHKVLLPKFAKFQNIIVRNYNWFIVIFLILLIPAYIGNNNYKVYYKLDESLPDDLAFNIANSKLADQFNIISPEIIILNKDLKTTDINNLVKELKSVEGIDMVLSPSLLVNENIQNLLPEDVSKITNNPNYQLIIINSTYEIASPELESQIETVNDIVKKYDDKGIIAGEGPLMNGLVQIADHDFKMVNYTSIIVIFIIMILVLKQVNLPILLIITIEFAIFINMSIPYYTNVSLPFIASIVVGTIQLGATIDYAILLSTTYLNLRKEIKDKKSAMKQTLGLTMPSIITSALCFFAATFAVAIYTQIDMIGSICTLLARGSIISMLVVLLILPALLMVSDKFIIKKEGNSMNKNKKMITTILVGMMCWFPLSTKAVTKTETVYINLDNEGNVTKKEVHNYLENKSTLDIVDNTSLTDITNLNGNEKFTLDKEKLVWQANGQDIFYKGNTTQDIPISTNIKYYLDGEELSLKEIKNKKGHVTMEINFINNTLLRKSNNFNPFVVTLGAILNNEDYSNITITNGKMSNMGSKSIVIGLSSPGLYQYTDIKEFANFDQIMISFDTEKFKSPQLYFVATPKLLDNTDLTIFDSVNFLASSINLISNNMDTVVNGLSSLSDGSKTLATKSQELTNSLSTVTKYLSQLEQGTVNLSKALNQIITSLNALDSMLEDPKLTESIKNINLLKEQNALAINNLQAINETLKTTYEENGLANFQNDQEIYEYFGNLNFDTATIQNLINCKKTYEGNQGLITLLTKNNEALNLSITNTEATMKKITTSLASLKSNLQKIVSGTDSLVTNTNQIASGLNQIYEGAQKLSSGNQSVYENLMHITDGVNTLNAQGIKKLVQYSNQALTYSNKFKSVLNLANNYRGYASNNADKTTFIYKIG